MTDPVVVPDLLRAHAMAVPARVAMMVDGAGAMSFADWQLRAQAVAGGLAARGTRHGDRVGLFFDNTQWLDYAVAYVGTLQAGAVAVPLSSRFTAREAGSILEVSGVSCLVAADEATFEAVAFQPQRLALLHELEAAGDPGPGARAPGTGGRAVSEPAAVRAEDLAEILYTSGTTGTPKGVACTHAHIVRPLVAGGGWPPGQLRAAAGGVMLHANSVSTAAGQLRLLDTLGPERLTTVAMPLFDPEQFCELAQQHRAKVVQLVPAMATAILDSGAGARHDLSSVSTVLLGCAPLPPAVLPRLAEAFPRATLINMYELSEARHVGTAMVHDGTRPGSVGIPRGMTEVRVTDEGGADLPAGAAGEIRMRWRGLAPQHYYRDAEATASVFAGGWTRTGDAGYLDADGYLFLTDRLKDVIIKGGLSISSVTVENALLEHPEVTEVAVVGVPDPAHGEQVAAAAVVRQQVTGAELREFLRGRIAGHMIPQQVRIVGELPRNRSGKVLKRELRELLAAPPASPDPAAQDEPAGHQASNRNGRAAAKPTVGSMAGVLTRIWAEVLGRESIPADQGFAELGGDSLLAARVGLRARESLGVQLSVVDIFESGTVAELASRAMQLSQEAGPGRIPLLPR